MHMANKKAVNKKVKKILKKEIDLPIKLPNNSVGRSLQKKRRIPLANYIAESWTELKKVTWPSRRESLKLTFAVVLFTAFFTLFTAVSDFGISNVVERVLL